ncbi:MAG: hypothetical protein ACYC4K_10535 [Thiobacillus sp.]
MTDAVFAQAFHGDDLIVGVDSAAFSTDEIRHVPAGTKVTFLRATQALVKMADGTELEMRSTNLRIG